MNQDLERLRSIKSFPSLVKYLRDQLDWEFETLDEFLDQFPSVTREQALGALELSKESLLAHHEIAA